MPETPRLHALPPGVDFARALIAGLDSRLPADPQVWARTTIFVSSGRMLRRLREVFDAGPPRLLPRLRTIADLAFDPQFPEIPPALPALHLQLDLAELVLRLIERNPDLAPRSAAFDLAASLVALIDEMHGEGVGPEALADLDVGDLADHWKRGRAIVEAAFTHLAADPGHLPGAEARRRQVVQALIARWQEAPPQDSVVIAGSTGSRGATRLLMEAVARLPHGHVVLPGFDFDQPPAVWSALDQALTGEDHPQYRFRALMRDLGLEPEQITPWHDTPAPDPGRNRLISLALRPAPVTDQWRAEGRHLTGIAETCSGMTLLLAPSRRDEAAAIALRLRKAAEDGQTAALITPDRMLTRRVAAALQRWGIEPDDSAGVPLQQTAPGRFLRLTAALFERAPELPALLSLLKHPLTASSRGLRGNHLRWTRELELYLRRRAHPMPGADELRAWAAIGEHADGRVDWAAWLGGLLDAITRGGAQGLGLHVARHLALAEALAAGPATTGSGELWLKAPGEAAAAAMRALAEAGGRGGMLAARDYAILLAGHLGSQTAQDPVRPHPGIMIWGTLEARVQAADLTILAGLNDGIWPDLPGADTWLNRAMRAEAGLLLPDRRIGLAAHDFQISVAAREVMLTRSARDDEAETVPSRWLNRLSYLLGGLGPEGKAALAAMTARGDAWLAQARSLDRPAAMVPPAPRPAPCPPVASRPRRLSVTEITRLIRDPYAIYARHVLGLAPLDPLSPQPDARVRGTALHRIMEDFLAVRDDWQDDPALARAALDTIAQHHFAEATPLPSIRALWQARLMAIAGRLIEGETARLAEGAPTLTERSGGIDLSGLDFRLTARPDRVDRLNDGTLAVYDYKSGRPPSDKEVLYFEKQLPLEAAMLERGGFSGIEPSSVARMGYVSLGTSEDREVQADHDGARLADVSWQGLHRLIGNYGSRTQGYAAIRAAQLTSYAGDFDHLARFGEWDLTDRAVPLPIGPEETA
ncbi:double-strand break repair protein AddB [Tropicimonas sp. IMCC34043]|uniref:double-strand break repair protein AddB n=1 Tax=Tropicimonas sp. IMCC34043 TaxID=2248760 RepID=UPI000E245BCC|nr:double-strand break repair protein AddB [Tropicimonas sp. IMCC34043]